VAARNSAFSYKGGAVDLDQVRREPGVRYLIEGSVRRAAARVRVNVETIDTESSGQIWPEKHVRRMSDIFALQDDMVAGIATTVGPEITQAEIGRTWNKRPETLDAWDVYLRASAFIHRMTAADLEAAIARLADGCGRSENPLESRATYPRRPSTCRPPAPRPTTRLDSSWA